jgi:hypothetical protein
MRYHPFDPIEPAVLAHRVRAAEIREATMAVVRAKQWIDVARSPAEHAQAQATLRQANRWLCRLNLET